MARFDGKIAVVTGAARGLGREYAQHFADDGARVILADLNAQGAVEAAMEMAACGADAVAYEVDISSVSSTEALAGAIRDSHGAVDFLINNAALYGDLQMGPLLETDPDYFDTVMKVNVKGAWLMTRALVPLMKGRSGRIVNMSSIGAWTAGGMYCLTKMALNQMTFSLAKEVAPLDITCNAVAPGAINNESTQAQVPADYMERLLDGVFIKRFGTGSDMYGAIRWLCSEDASWVTGQIISPNGGSHTSF